LCLDSINVAVKITKSVVICMEDAHRHSLFIDDPALLKSKKPLPYEALVRYRVSAIAR
jgi:hypothetical protein